MVQVLMGFHAVLALVLLQAIFANKSLAANVMFVHIVSLEVGKMFNYFSTLKTLMTFGNVTHRERALK